MKYRNKFYIDENKVSIIMPTYNSSKYLGKAVESVQNQTYENWEIIIVDDVSSDETLKIAHELSSVDYRIKLYPSYEKIFTPGARNLGISKSIGRFIAFLDSDDMWHYQKLEKQISDMINKNIFFSYTGVEKIDSGGISNGYLTVPHSISYKKLLRGNKICCSSVILDRFNIETIEFSNNIKIVEDYALWLKILRESGSNALGINEPLTYYRIHDKAKTSNKLISAFDTWKVLRKSENLSIIKSIIPFFFYVKEGFRKLLVR